MNSAGVMDGQNGVPSLPPMFGRSQRDSAQTVTPNCQTAPTTHSTLAASDGPVNCMATVASSSSEIGMAATKTWRTGWFRSSSSAFG
jgi:hypothetical protein